MVPKILSRSVLWTLIAVQVSLAGESDDSKSAKPGDTVTDRVVAVEDGSHGSAIRLNLDSPEEFVDAYFSDPKKLVGTRDASTGAIDGRTKILVSIDKQEIAIDAELITFRVALGLSTVGINQAPTTLEKAEGVAIKLCKMTGGDPEVIEKWVRNERANANTNGTVALARGRSLGGTHTVEIRRSLGSPRQWRTLYTFTRRAKEGGKK